MFNRNLKKRISELEAEVERLKKKDRDWMIHDEISKGFINCIECALLDPDFKDVPSGNLRGKAIFAAIRRLHQLSMK